MDEGTKRRLLSELLNEASMLLSSSSSTFISNPAANSSRSAIPQVTINEALRCAHGICPPTLLRGSSPCKMGFYHC